MKLIALFFPIVLMPSFLFSQTENGGAIYNEDTITWFGADFSLFRLTNDKKVGKDEELKEYIFAWNIEYKNSISNVKLASWLSVNKVHNDKEFTDDAYKSFLAANWINTEKHKISRAEIEKHLSHYTSGHKGLGLVYILENFYKGAPIGVPSDDMTEVSGYFVWFDIESKSIVHIHNIIGNPPNSINYLPSTYWKQNQVKMPKDKVMTGIWLLGMVDATVKFSIEYKDGLPKVEKEY